MSFNDLRSSVKEFCIDFPWFWLTRNFLEA